MRNEKVFTPEWLVRLMLDQVPYKGERILSKHVIDNSCGNGAFLTQILKRYCSAYIEEFGHDDGLKTSIETYIHGNDVDDGCVEVTKAELDKVAEEFGVTNVTWDITVNDALTYKAFDGKMDYVIGNPPYCNVHDLGERYSLVKTFDFCRDGMTDLYLAFFEVGLRMLSERGTLMYITPSSWTTSLAGKRLREWMMATRKVGDIITLGHEKVFKNANTYTIITKIVNDYPKDFDTTLYRYNPSTVSFDYVATRDIGLFNVDGTFHFDENVGLLRKVSDRHRKSVIVKNGFATLNDKLFIIEKDSEWRHKLDIYDDNIILAYKLSQDDVCNLIVYPYDKYGWPLQWDDLSDKTREYLSYRIRQLHIDNKVKGQWWLYGRTQAIKDVWRWKCGINNLVRDNADFKIQKLAKKVGMYGGYYVMPVYDFDSQRLISALEKMASGEDKEFIPYIKALGRYKNGGYYTFTTKEIEDYLNYRLDEE